MRFDSIGRKISGMAALRSAAVLPFVPVQFG